MSDEENDRYRAPALDKGLDILELLAAVDGGLTQAEIAKRLGRSPNEFYRMLDRLVKRVLDRMAVVNDLVESHLGQLRGISRP